MTTPPSTDSSESRVRERLLVPGHPLALTIAYAEPALREPLLALHALIGEISAVPGEVSDPGVAQRKLAWWRGALDEPAPHPAVLAWSRSGADRRVPAQCFDALIDAVAREIVAPRFESQAALAEHARAVAGPAAALEARLVAPDRDDATHQALAAAAGAAYRIRVVRDLVLDAGRDRWLVPLDLQAEFGLTRQQVATGEHAARIQALVRNMALQAVLDHDRAIGRIDSSTAWRQRHLLLRLHLDRRLGRAITRKPARVMAQRVTATGLLDGLSLWRRARRLARARPAPRSDP